MWCIFIIKQQILDLLSENIKNLNHVRHKDEMKLPTFWFVGSPPKLPNQGLWRPWPLNPAVDGTRGTDHLRLFCSTFQQKKHSSILPNVIWWESWRYRSINYRMHIHVSGFEHEMMQQSTISNFKRSILVYYFHHTRQLFVLLSFDTYSEQCCIASIFRTFFLVIPFACGC